MTVQCRATSARVSSAQAHIIQVERKRRGREAAPSFVQPAAFDHVHEVVHALRHLPAQAVDVMLGVDPRGRRLESPLEVLLGFSPRFCRQGEPQPLPHPRHGSLVWPEVPRVPWLDTCVVAVESLELVLAQSLLELARDLPALIEATAKVNERDAWLIGTEPRVDGRPELANEVGHATDMVASKARAQQLEV